MPHYLLIGAGFTRNWGGPLSDEVTGSLLGDLHQYHELATVLRKEPFENAFAGFQQTTRRLPEHLQRLQDAVTSLFQRVNVALLEATFEFCNDVEFSVAEFLAKFDAIFSLNQDLLLECHYIPRFAKRGRWSGVIIPGMTLTPSGHTEEHWGPVGQLWVPSEKFDLPANMQPLVKLHGSMNWRAATGQPILVMGNAKSGAIQSFNTLRQSHEFFASSLNRPNSKLMVIGYSFQDDHINKVIEKASDGHGLGTFIVDPNGRSVLQDPRMAHAQIKNPRSIEGIRLIGELRRPLSQVFNRDKFAFQEIMRFFL